MSRKSKLKMVHQRIRHEMFGCYTCSDSGEGDTYWENNHTDLYDFVCDLVSEEKLEKMLGKIYCPRCHCEFTSTADEVLRKSYSDIKAEEILEEVYRAYPVLDDFHDYLALFPYLGLNAPRKIGQKILKGLAKKKGIQLKNQIWYRARLLNVESRLFKKEELWAPNPKEVKVSEGRYNHSGMSFLYLSENAKTAFLEVKSGTQNVCAVQKFRLNTVENVLDLRTDYCRLNVKDDIYALALIHGDHLTKKTDKTSSWKPEYLVPRFVADAARFLGFKGVLFSSVHRTGNNLILFEFSDSTVSFDGEPTLFTLDEKQDVFLKKQTEAEKFGLLGESPP